MKLSVSVNIVERGKAPPARLFFIFAPYGPHGAKMKNTPRPPYAGAAAPATPPRDDEEPTHAPQSAPKRVGGMAMLVLRTIDRGERVQSF